MLEALRALRTFRLPAGGLGQAPFPRAVLWGACDRLVPPAQGERVAAALGVPLEVLADVGHCVPEERPEAVLRALEALVHAGASARLTSAPVTREEEPPGGRAPP
jgi:pimeloyl-ACP methyl ester carboxylesterase